MLNLQRAGGSLTLGRWPREANGRPILMHVASIAFHYGPEVAAVRHSNVWFQELGGVQVGGPHGATKSLEELFRDLWIPEMVIFVEYQLQRALRSGEYRQGADGLTAEEAQRRREVIKQWSDSPHPFFMEVS